MMKQLRWLALLVASATLFGACHSRPTIERKQGAAPARQPVRSSHVVAPGIIEPWGDEARLALEQPGQIAEIRVNEGDTVRAGQLLVRLEDSAQLHAVELARAELAEAEARLNALQRGSTSEELALARAERESARELAGQSERDAARSSALNERGAASEADAERAASEARALKLSAAASEAREKLVVRGPRAEERRAGRARLAAASARLAAAEAMLQRRQLLAPKATRVLWSRWQVGELYSPDGQPLIVAGDLDRLQVRTEVDELDAPRVRAGMSCELYTDDGLRLATGKVVRSSPSYGRRGLRMDAPTSRNDVRIREVFVEVAGSEGLAPGQRVWVHVATSDAS